MALLLPCMKTNVFGVLEGQIYASARAGTKHIIEAFVDEVCASLTWLARQRGLSAQARRRPPPTPPAAPPYPNRTPAAPFHATVAAVAAATAPPPPPPIPASRRRPCPVPARGRTACLLGGGTRVSWLKWPSTLVGDTAKSARVELLEAQAASPPVQTAARAAGKPALASAARHRPPRSRRVLSLCLQAHRSATPRCCSRGAPSWESTTSAWSRRSSR